MSKQTPTHDILEDRVVRYWRASGISEGSIVVYKQCVRRFRTYCCEQNLEEFSESTLAGVTRFQKAYIGPRKGKKTGKSSQLTARNAIHAWAYALSSMEISIPPWTPARSKKRLSPLLESYRSHRKKHRGVSDATLHMDIVTAKEFISVVYRKRVDVKEFDVL